MHFPYPLKRTEHASPALCPGCVLLKLAPLGQPLSLHPLRSPLTNLVRRLPWYCRVVRLPMTTHHRLASSDFPMRPPFPCEQRQSWDLPIPASRETRDFRACLGSTTAQGPCASRVIDAHRVAFRYVHSVGSLEQEAFHGSIAGPHVPLSTLRSGPCGPQRMTRGRCGSLYLHRMTLSFTTRHRFSSALSSAGSNTTSMNCH